MKDNASQFLILIFFTASTEDICIWWKKLRKTYTNDFKNDLDTLKSEFHRCEKAKSQNVSKKIEQIMILNHIQTNFRLWFCGLFEKDYS